MILEEVGLKGIKLLYDVGGDVMFVSVDVEEMCEVFERTTREKALA